MRDEPAKAWTLPSGSDLPILAEALRRALDREAAGAPRNRAWVHCRRWHRRWHSGMRISDGHPFVDCSRCGLRWVW